MQLPFKIQFYTEPHYINEKKAQIFHGRIPGVSLRGTAGFPKLCKTLQEYNGGDVM